MPNDKLGSVKHDLIQKSNSRMLIMIGVAGAILGFSMVASYTLFKQLTYRERVLAKKADASEQLETNIESIDKLVVSYAAFNDSAESVIGTADNNAKVVLDALPSKYDYPALVSSLDKIFRLSGISEASIGGTDNEAAAEQSSTSPQPLEIPIELSGRGSYQNAQQLVQNFERSIRPIKINRLGITGDNNILTINVDGLTYYQPKKELTITKEEVK